MGKLIGVLFVIAFIFALGRTTADTTETKVEVKTVRVPDTHVVTETVVQPEPMPADCKSAIDLLNKSVEANHRVGEKAGKIADLTDDLGGNIAQSEIQQYVKTQQDIHDNKLGLDNANVEVLRTNDLIQRYLTDCNKALKGDN